MGNRNKPNRSIGPKISWLPEEASAISAIHSEDDLLLYMQSFSKSFLMRMGVRIFP